MTVRIALVGEAAAHRADLVANLDVDYTLIELPAEAAWSSDYDHQLAGADVVVSLRFSRPVPIAWNATLFQVPGAGTDEVELDAIPARTSVCKVYEHEAPMAEFALASMLAWQIRPDLMRISFTTQPWERLYAARPRHGELSGKTVGLIGYGHIGRAISSRASPFGVRLIAIDDHAKPDACVTPWPLSRLDELLAQSDFIVVACPLTERTRGLVDHRSFSLMKSTAVLVNIARAAIIDEDALFEALLGHLIGGAILDVWYQYPKHAGEAIAPAHHDFTSLDNAWCTPHSAAWTDELSVRRYTEIASNINALVKGEPLHNLVRSGLAFGARSDTDA